ncbi:MAG: hypothetical protein HY725_14220 [Candidatus Rokubacteria bacterium]|nr:hypothetical protein [Candidatus Rokubacteria bacterium]
MRVRERGKKTVEGWEGALVRRLSRLPRSRAPARLRRRILAALAALEREAKGHEA